ncbi:hypothetical protein SCG7086_BM_00080 [Chlamydiales bacterium SCGC AG-110-P3]|nr:hypothetical protein SCG7086_BM_00080 [Chlamydiales bacterium SCGC AG-110-P3]
MMKVTIIAEVSVIGDPSDCIAIFGVVHFRVTLLGTETLENDIALRGTQNRFWSAKVCFGFFCSQLAGVSCGYLRILKIDSNAFSLPQVRSLDAIELRHLFLYLEQLTDPRGRQQAGYKKSESKLSHSKNGLAPLVRRI